MLGRLIDELPEIFLHEILPRLDKVDRVLLARVGSATRAAVVQCKLPRAGSSSTGARVNIVPFVKSVKYMS